MEVKEPDARYARPPQRALTELGELPIDWRVAPLDELNPVVTSGSRGWAAYYSESGAIFLRITNLSRSRIYPSVDDLRYVVIPEEGSEGVRTALQIGDVLISITADIGMIGWVPSTLSLPAYINQHIALVRIASERANSRYLAYFLAGAASQRRFKALTDAGAKAGMSLAGVRQQVLAALPPPSEQQAIAEALSDADVLIESLSLLLAKKRQIKQGAMQELLTGKKRLPGFQGHWIECSFRSIAAARKDRVNPGLLATPPRCVELEQMQSGSGRLEGDAFESTQSATKTVFAKGDVLFGKLRAYLRKYWRAEFDGVCSTEIWALRPAGLLQSSAFLFYTVQRDEFIEAASSAYGTHMPRSDWNVIGGLALRFPEDAEEQYAIAQVLSNMSDEIAAIESRLEKARDLKQGMMQALLTGRIRLVPSASNVTPLPTKPAAANPPRTQPAHNWQINEAVVIGVLSHRFGSEQFPLPRKRRVKLTYLLHRHAEGRAEGYLKKAAGPYDPNTKYKGPEQIALKNGYVRALRNATYEGFVAGDKIEQAQRYFDQWYGPAALQWLERFHYRKTNELELLATVDMAMVDLAATGEQADVAGVRRVIAAHPEWLPKLSRDVFSDDNITRAIAECAALFPA